MLRQRFVITIGVAGIAVRMAWENTKMTSAWCDVVRHLTTELAFPAVPESTARASSSAAASSLSSGASYSNASASGALSSTASLSNASPSGSSPTSSSPPSPGVGDSSAQSAVVAQTRATLDQLEAGTLVKDIVRRRTSLGKVDLVYVVVCINNRHWTLSLPLGLQDAASDENVAIIRVALQQVQMLVRKRGARGQIAATAWTPCEDSASARAIIAAVCDRQGLAAPSSAVKNRRGKFEGTRSNTVKSLLEGSIDTDSDTVTILTHGVNPPRSLIKTRPWSLKLVPDDAVCVWFVRAKGGNWRRTWDAGKMPAKAQRAAKAALEEFKAMEQH